MSVTTTHSWSTSARHPASSKIAASTTTARVACFCCM